MQDAAAQMVVRAARPSRAARAGNRGCIARARRARGSCARSDPAGIRGRSAGPTSTAPSPGAPGTAAARPRARSSAGFWAAPRASPMARRGRPRSGRRSRTRFPSRRSAGARPRSPRGPPRRGTRRWSRRPRRRRERALSLDYHSAMPLFSIGERRPELRGEHHFIAHDATLVGSIMLENNVSVWFQSVIRGGQRPGDHRRGTATSRTARCCTSTRAIR